MKKLTKNEVIKSFIKIHKHKYNYSLFVDYLGTSQKIKIICNKCNNDFEQLIQHHKKGIGCPNCSNKRLSEKNRMDIKTIIKKSKEIHFDKYDYSLVDYKNNRTKVKIICNICNMEFEQTFNQHLRGQGCPKCGLKKRSNSRKLTIEDFIKKSKEIHDKKYDYSLANYIDNKTKVKIICKKCNNIFSQTPNHHKNGAGCPKCANNIKSKNMSNDTETFINKSIKIHGNNYNYSNTEYINSKNKVKIICNNCNNIFLQSPPHHLSGEGCPKCNKSKGENKIEYFLLKNNIKYISQYRFDDCRSILPLPFDFFIPDYNICIEYDGEQHFKIVEHWGGKKSYLIRQKHDKIKNDYCKNHNIKLLRINYIDLENIDEKLNIFNNEN